jgi:class 3 adenylate cyclase/tetratricopeptide (TPR) repeat protein
MNLGDWLRSLGLGQYETTFRDNGIDADVLFELSEADFEKLGVLLGHRRRLIKAIATLKNAAGGPVQGRPHAEPAPKPHDAAERRQLTVMFCDLVGSTAMSARFDPEDMRGIIGSYHQCCADVIERNGGFIAKYMGDGVLAYFGYPQAHEHDAERAVRAGLALVEAAPKLETPAGAPLHVRVGIATGIVVVGDLLGSGEAQERGVVGNTPNLAARLQGIAAPDSVVIAEGTRKLLGNLFELRDLGPQGLKGVVGQTHAYAALRESAQENRFEALHAGGLIALVGRDEESELLLGRWAMAKAGEGQVVLLSGEAGIGKSRLTAAFLERLAGEPHVRLRYFCSPQHTDSALHPIIRHMARAAGFARNDDTKTKLDKLDALLATSATSREDAALLAELLSLPAERRNPALDLAPQQRRQKTMEALIRQIEVISRQSPVLMIFEDAHWADPSSVELFGRLVDKIDGLPILLFMTFRPEFAAPWIGRPHVTALTINRLMPRQAMALIEQIAGNRPLAENLRQGIVERTDGIPLFVEEMTKAVLEAEGERAAAHTLASIPSPVLAVPASLHASLMARLDRLGPAKGFAQIGAAIGREFSHALLAAVARKPDAELGSALDRLIDAGLLFRQGVPPHASYLFKHGLVQDAAYGTMLREPRRALHARIAETLEDQFAEIAENQPELLARHCTEADRIEQAIDYWLKAGQHAMHQSAHIEAERHLRRGLELLIRLPETPVRLRREIALQNTLGVCLMPARGFGSPEVAAAFNRAAEVCTRVNDDRGLFIALRGNGQYHMISGDMRTACGDARRILALAEEVGNHDFLIEAHHLGWSAHCFAGEFRAAQRHAEQGISRYERERDHHLTYTYSGHDPGVCARAFGSLSLGQLGYPEKALAACREGVALAEMLAHPFSIGIALWAAGILHQLRREPDATRQVGERMIHYGGEKGLQMILPFGKVFRGDAMTQDGDCAEGIVQMREGISELRSMGTLFSQLGLFARLADAFARCGNVDDGLAVIEEGLAMMRSGGENFSLPEIHRIQGKLLLASSDRDAAEAAFREALSVAHAQQAKSLELRAATSLARLWRDQGRRAEAQDLLTPIYGWFSEGFDTLDLKEAKAMLGEVA